MSAALGRAVELLGALKARSNLRDQVLFALCRLVDAVVACTPSRHSVKKHNEGTLDAKRAELLDQVDALTDSLHDDELAEAMQE